MRNILLFFVIFLNVHLALAQTRQIDSLKLRLKKRSLPDTVHVNDLNELGWQYLDYSVDSSRKYVQKGLELSRRLNFVNGLIDAKNTQGILYRYTNEPEKAIELYSEIIKLRKEQGRIDRLTGAYSNLGSVYFEKGDNATALSYYLKAYDNASDLKQTKNQLVLLNNLGAVYKSSGLYDLAIDVFKKGLELNKAIKDDLQSATFYINLATIYDHQKLFKESVKYERYAYDIFKKTANIRQLSVVLNNLSLSLRHLKDYKATEAILKEMQEVADYLNENGYYVGLYQTRANYFIEIDKFPEALLEINKVFPLIDTINYRQSLGNSFLIKSDIYYMLKDYDKAMLFCDKGLQIVKDADEKYQLVNVYHSKSQIYQAMGDFKSSLLYYQRADRILDSLNTDAINTKMATLNSLYDLERKENELQLSIKEKEAVEAKNKQQSIFLIAAITIGILVIIFLVFSIRAYFVKKRDNMLLNTQKQEIELKNNALLERQVEIENQKLLIEEKQKEILDSIRYAKRIQNTLLANHKIINRNLKENFILFKPKDIVSGDFYWAAEKNDCFYLAVCDSTGHGVPGAFMSLLNISFLNEAINEKNITEPNEVLNHVRYKLISSISQDGGQDGMDCVLMCFDKKNSTITYAAAQNKLVLVREKELIEFPADKMPVGKGEDMRSFTLRTIHPQKGDLLYLYSDGYADQFGGEKGKKFKYKTLNELLLKNAELPLPEQARLTESTFESWKGKQEQVDDVVLIGIRL